MSVLTAESNKTAVCISLPLTHTNSSVFPSSHVSLMGIYLLISKQRVFIKGLPPGCHIKQHISDNKKQKIMLLPTIQKAFWLLCIKPVISSHFGFQNLLINKRYIVIIPSTSPSVHNTANKRVSARVTLPTATTGERECV